MVGGSNGRQAALNNVGFFARGSQRWTLRWASLRTMVRRDVVTVRLAVHRSEVLIVPYTAMAKGVAAIALGLRGRIVQANPVSGRTGTPADR